jgi:hypothetical protein
LEKHIGSSCDHLELLATAWPILARAEVDPVFALFFEASGLAATGREPRTSRASVSCFT